MKVEAHRELERYHLARTLALFDGVFKLDFRAKSNLGFMARVAVWHLLDNRVQMVGRKKPGTIEGLAAHFEKQQQFAEIQPSKDDHGLMKPEVLMGRVGALEFYRRQKERPVDESADLTRG